MNPQPRIREILEQSHISDLIPISSADLEAVNQNGTPQKDKEPPGRLRYLVNQEEEDRLMGGCRGTFKALVVVALHTGMRRGELLRLKWEDVDLEQGYIHIKETKRGERRAIPMNETVWSLMSSLRSRQDIPWVFHNEEGQPYRDTHKIFMWVCKRANITDFRFHDLRHTFSPHGWS